MAPAGVHIAPPVLGMGGGFRGTADSDSTEEARDRLRRKKRTVDSFE